MEQELMDEIRTEWRESLPQVIRGRDPLPEVTSIKLILDKPPTGNEILRRVAEQTNCRIGDLRGHAKQPDLVQARAVACYLIHWHLPELSHEQIGKILNRERTTICYSIKRSKELLAIDPDFSLLARQVERSMGL